MSLSNLKETNPWMWKALKVFRQDNLRFGGRGRYAVTDTCCGAYGEKMSFVRLYERDEEAGETIALIRETYGKWWRRTRRPRCEHRLEIVDIGKLYDSRHHKRRDGSGLLSGQGRGGDAS